MSNLQEDMWYKMMGLSKMFLRNFIIGSFMVLLLTVGTLASLLNESNKERLRDERQYRTDVEILRKTWDEIKELKNIEYIKLLKEALEAQKHIDREIKNLQNDSSNKK